MTLQIGCRVPHHFIFTIARQSNQTGDRKKLSRNNICPTLSTGLVKCLTYASITLTLSITVYEDKTSSPMCSLLHHKTCQTFVVLRCTLSINYLNSEFQNK